jgi:alkanesulfonate monooxygenase SsuD/methylene tetrahydromethanopterin reductase-like flavin-dependent oxidoreductase (luciferase family)
MDILEEQLQVVLGNWSDGLFSFNGEHYQLHDLDAEPKPVQRPHPPLIIGGSAAPRSCELAARFADEYNTAYTTVADVRERRGRLDEACERLGRGPMPLSIVTAVITGVDEDDLRERVARVAHIEGVAPEALIDEPPYGWVIGLVEPVAEQLRAFREAGVSRVICQHLAHDDLDFIALLGSELAPMVT